MIRWATAGVVLFLVACGGGGGTPAATLPTLFSLFPVASTATNTVYVYDVTKTVTVGVPGAPATAQRGFHIGHSAGLDKIARFFGFSSPGVPDLDVGAASAWTARGLEAAAYGALDLSTVGGPCVTMTTPGVLVAPAAFQPGQTHTCTIPGMFDQMSITWVGPEATAGYPNAQRVEFSLAGPYTGRGVGSRATATRVTVIGTVHLVSGIGPVDGTVTQRYLDGAAVLETRAYVFNGLVIQPPP